ncbi:methylated-DNA-[protein]-cysteine S-methyltransferase [Actinomycetospora succinea]|uniref:methylated-DNA--[protein]-cysteine S-methyltransferase n=1 Tax=Actinomycetospora succinea TaxID=663603 RepID=A0A4R6VHM0_9PSEU|nr:methylated-DNA--[protein]-cysteine S-methyltransferase [Actinomycetospora succinea]TDQ60960.1 methylated-DNA-[protein]-cysteine S-methyltransferase [Actinomycetospora succinea]
MTTSTTHPTVLGPLSLSATEHGISFCAFEDTPRKTWKQVKAVRPTGDSEVASLWLSRACQELDAYFAGALAEFTVQVDLRSVPEFDRRVLAALQEVPAGRTTTYGELAVRAGAGPQGARRVGGVMARNPVLVLVACHRVLGASGDLTGYAGGLERKRALLDLERETAADLPAAS